MLLTACAPSAGPPTADARPDATATENRAATPRPAGTHQARPAASQVVPERPVELVLPSGTTLPVDVSMTDHGGRLSLPQDVDRAGWWRDGARLGDPFGAIVLAAHVDSFAEGIGPIVELLEATPGDAVHLRSRSLAQAYVVSSAELVPRTELSRLSPLMSFAYGSRLVLITCGGPYNSARGGYRDNLVVVAEPRGRLRRSP